MANRHVFEVACFTGHRPNKLGGYNPDNPTMREARMYLAKAIRWSYDHGVRTFISGMALGIDQIGVEEAIEFKLRVDPKVKIIGAIPCHEQDKKWPPSAKKHYLDIFSKLDDVHFVTHDWYTPECMQLRNKWMVDNSHLVIAVWDGSEGGTGNCIKYARDRRRPILWINPKENWRTVLEEVT